MKDVLLILQIIISISLIILVSIQAKGTGLGRSFGFGSSLSFQRRGLEKLIFKLTFTLVTLFIVVSVISLFL